MSLDDRLVRVKDEAVGAGEGEVGEGGIFLQLLETVQDAVPRPVEGADGDLGDHRGGGSLLQTMIFLKNNEFTTTRRTMMINPNGANSTPMQIVHHVDDALFSNTSV